MNVSATADASLMVMGRPAQIANYSPVSTSEIAGDPSIQKLAREMSAWMDSTRGAESRGNMFDRKVYTPPDSPYDLFRTAEFAVAEDDVVGGVADATEAIAFHGGMKWESESADEADVLNQWAADVNLDGKVREMWRENFQNSQAVVGMLWSWHSYKPRNATSRGNKRKKVWRFWAPSRLVIINSRQVVPVGFGPLRTDRLAWQATPFEIGAYSSVMSGDAADPLMSAMFKGIYKPGMLEQMELGQWGVDANSLLEMHPEWVFRHCRTRPDYKKFPDLRLRRIFSDLDLKRQLISSDRASLIAAANYILLIRKGTDQAPAKQAEIDALKRGYQFLARLPVMISDHRLSIDIIAPKQDFTLVANKYDLLDRRILAGSLASFVAPVSGASTESANTFNEIMSHGIESERHMLKRTIEREIAMRIVRHPLNDGLFEERPSLVFTPRGVSVGTDQAILSAMLSLRTQSEISRETILETIGFDQATEALRLENERAVYDKVFQTKIPFAAPGAQPGFATPEAQPPSEDPGGSETPNGTPEAPQNSGRRGGRPRGGGESPKSPAATAKPKTGNGNPSTPKAA